MKMHTNVVASKRKMPVFAVPSATGNEIYRLSLCLSMLVKSRIPLSRSIKRLLEDDWRPEFRVALEKVSDDLERNVPFSMALEKHPHVFPSILSAGAKIVEEGGSSVNAFDAVADISRNSMHWYENMSILPVKYPAIAYFPFIYIIILGLIQIRYGMNLFTTGYYGYMTEQPVVYSLFEGGFILPGVLVYLCFYFLAGKSRSYLCDIFCGIPFKIPRFGFLLQRAKIVQALKIFKICLEFGIHPVRALEISADAVESRIYKERFLRAAELVKDGLSFSAAFEICEILSGNTLLVFESCEKAGELSHNLDIIIEFWESRIGEEMYLPFALFRIFRFIVQLLFAVSCVSCIPLLF